MSDLNPDPNELNFTKKELNDLIRAICCWQNTSSRLRTKLDDKIFKNPTTNISSIYTDYAKDEILTPVQHACELFIPRLQQLSQNCPLMESYTELLIELIKNPHLLKNKVNKAKYEEEMDFIFSRYWARWHDTVREKPTGKLDGPNEYSISYILWRAIFGGMSEGHGKIFLIGAFSDYLEICNFNQIVKLHEQFNKEYDSNIFNPHFTDKTDLFRWYVVHKVYESFGIKQVNFHSVKHFFPDTKCNRPDSDTLYAEHLNSFPKPQILPKNKQAFFNMHKNYLWEVAFYKQHKNAKYYDERTIPMSTAIFTESGSLNTQGIHNVIHVATSRLDDLKLDSEVVERSIDNATEIAISNGIEHLFFPLICAGNDLDKFEFTNEKNKQEKELTIAKFIIGQALLARQKYGYIRLYFVDFPPSTAFHDAAKSFNLSENDDDIILIQVDILNINKENKYNNVAIINTINTSLSAIPKEGTVSHKILFKSNIDLQQFMQREWQNLYQKEFDDILKDPRVLFNTLNEVSSNILNATFGAPIVYSYQTPSASSVSSFVVDPSWSCLDANGKPLSKTREEALLPAGAAICTKLSPRNKQALNGIDYLIHVAPASCDYLEGFQDIQPNDIRNSIINLINIAFAQEITDVFIPLICGGEFSSRVNLASSGKINFAIATEVLLAAYAALKSHQSDSHVVKLYFVDFGTDTSFTDAYKNLQGEFGSTHIKPVNCNILDAKYTLSSSSHNSDRKIAIVNPSNIECELGSAGLSGVIRRKLGLDAVVLEQEMQRIAEKTSPSTFRPKKYAQLRER